MDQQLSIWGGGGMAWYMDSFQVSASWTQLVDVQLAALLLLQLLLLLVLLPALRLQSFVMTFPLVVGSV